ncbi:hypothetical protein [Hydrogenophaga palleronii]|uniref:hypothetical protein n=1 Tax=Hydrogenophaga palleronii TaxID=65655 RepID=UPI000AB5F6A4|nr:hypothetical protein [Hydrogenophaga palleronii]
MPREKIAVRTPKLGAYVVERLSYIDSIFFRTIRRLDEADLMRLKKTLIPDERFSKRRYFGAKRPYTNPVTGRTLFHYVHVVHQPMRATLELLQDIQECDPKLLHLLDVHVALDLTTRSQSDAAKLHEAVLAVHTPARLGTTDHDQEVETSYVGKRTNGNEVAIYSNGERKVRPDSSRVHLEWRVHGAKALKRAKMAAADQVVKLDYRAFWAKHLRLNVMPTLPRLVRVLELRAARSGRPMSAKQIQGLQNALSRISQDYEGRYFAQGLDEYLLDGVHPKPSRLYKSVSNEWALPAPGNALWDD